MRFVVDAQLPPAPARMLSTLGHSAVHVSEVGLAASGDRDIWNHALQEDAAIVTKDEDFAVLSLNAAANEPAVVWVRCGNTRKRDLLASFERLLPAILDRLASGERLIEIV